MKQRQSLLVFRLSSLGDVALTVPVIISVLEQNPEVHIDFATPKFMHALFPPHNRLRLLDFDKKNENSGLHGLIKFFNSLNLKKYIAIIDLHNVLRTIMLSKSMQLLGNKVFTLDKDRSGRKSLIQKKRNQPLKQVTEKYADVFRKAGYTVELSHELTNFLHPNIQKINSIGIAPFAHHRGKQIDLEKIKTVIDILSKNYRIILFGSKDEIEQIKDWQHKDNISLSNANGLRNDLKVMATLQLMISMDSANMHLASLVGVPVISIWGVTHPNAGFLGYGQHLENVIQDESLTWRPTSIYGKKLGPIDNPNGMKNIKVEDIIIKIEKVLKIGNHA